MLTKKQFHVRARRSGARAFTLLELVVVVAILVVLAGVAVIRGGAIREDANKTTTMVTLTSARNAITGTPGDPGFREDVGQIPGSIEELFILPNVTISDAQHPAKPVLPFEPSTGHGWNGPYISRPTGVYKSDLAAGFLVDYGTDGAPAILDAWHRPLILQIPTTPGLSLEDRVGFSRLVSAGADGIVNTSPAAQSPDITKEAETGDDLVLYLFRANGP